MRKWALALVSLPLIAVALAQEGSDGAAPAVFDQLDTVVIVGERTPPLWKLTKKGHVLWILGSFRPQSRGAQLNSQRLDQIIASANEVLLPGPAYVASPGFSAMAEIVKSDRNPDGATLQGLLPADAYAKWVTLRQKYSTAAVAGQAGPKFAWSDSGSARWVLLTEQFRGGDGIDTMRPTFAWEGLRRAALDRNGLVSYDLEAVVSAIATKHSVPVRKLHFGREFIFVWSTDPVVDSIDSKNANPAEILGRIDYGDRGCLLANLDLLEPVLARRKIQADAWARGDLATARDDGGVRLRDCITELAAAVSGGRLPASVDAKKVQDRYYRANRDSGKEVQHHWMSAVQDAVKKNEVTFSMVPIDQLLEEDGYLAALRDKGFVPAEPDSIAR